jgi:hypothetical protein
MPLTSIYVSQLARSLTNNNSDTSSNKNPRHASPALNLETTLKVFFKKGGKNMGY